jgi:hypothetical protein
MGRRIETSIDIAAPPRRVWEILTDFRRMPQWNPFIRSISGPLTTGAQLSVEIVPPGRKGMRFEPTLLAVDPDRELRWLGRVLMRGVFDGEHYFRLEPNEAGGTRFVQGELFGGILVAFFGSALAATEKGFGDMNAALKAQAEKIVS